MSKIKWKKARAGHPRFGTFVDDRDGQEYKCVRIGDQVWMVDNLNYAGGWAYDTDEELGELPFKTQNVGDGSHIHYSENRTETRVYSWASAMDMPSAMNKHGLNGCDKNHIQPSRLYKDDMRFQGIAPKGWRLPNNEDIEILGRYIEDNPEYAFFVKVEPYEYPGDTDVVWGRMYFWTSEEFGTDCAIAAYLLGMDADFNCMIEPMTKVAYLPVRCILR